MLIMIVLPEKIGDTVHKVWPCGSRSENCQPLSVKVKNMDEKRDKQADEPVGRIRLTEAEDDWLRAGRLARKAKKGDNDAARSRRRF